jgi:TonB family protein
MKGLLRLCFSFSLLVCASPPCVADTTKDLRDVFTHMPLPQYPPEASWRSSNGWRLIEGRTICRVSLHAQGAVTEVRIIKSSGNKTLDAASTGALRRWRGRPGRSGRFFDIPINFQGRALPANRNYYDGLGHTRSSDVGR